MAALKKSADDVLQATEPGKERERVEQRMAQIQSRWDNVQKNTTDRKTLLDRIDPAAQDYGESLHSFLSWLVTAEKNTALLKYVPCDRKGPQKYEELLKEMESDLQEKESALIELDQIARSLLEFNPADANIVNAQVQDVRNRYVALQGILLEKANKLEKIKQLLENFNFRRHAVEELVVQGVVVSAYKTPLMDADKIAEELALIQELLDAFADQEEELVVVQSVGMELLDLLEDDAPDAAIIRNQVDALYTRFHVTRDHLQRRRAQLDKHNQHLVPFRENIEQLENWFETFSATVEDLEPVSTEPEKLKKQLAEAEELQREIQEKTYLLKSAQTEGEWMMEHSKEDEDMVIDVVTILSGCHAKMDRVTAYIDQRHSRLQSAVIASQSVEVTFAEFVDDLSRIEEQLAGMRPISVVRDTLKEQERQFEVEISQIFFTKHSQDLNCIAKRCGFTDLSIVQVSLRAEPT